jgi:transcriptional regulator with XRE-family HTH domain
MGVMKLLKDNLNKQLKDHGLSLTELAKKAKVPKTNIHSWTTGANPQLDQLKRVADVLKVSIHELAFGTADPYEAKSEEILKELFTGDVRVTLHRIERKRQ